MAAAGYTRPYSAPVSPVLSFLLQQRVQRIRSGHGAADALRDDRQPTAAIPVVPVGRAGTGRGPISDSSWPGESALRNRLPEGRPLVGGHSGLGQVHGETDAAGAVEEPRVGLA
jgi:hypothetical protein